MPTRSPRTWFVNFLLIVGSLLAFTLLVELGLQLFFGIIYPRFTRIDPVLGWFHEPGASRLMEKEGHRYRLSYNQHGYRVPEHAYEKPPGIHRIIVLGDSFTDGSEVDDTETFTYLLQQQLDSVEVINLGVYGYSPSQELLTLERQGLHYQPDLVLVITTPNDFLDLAINITNLGRRPRHVLTPEGLRFEPIDSPPALESFAATTLPLPGRTWLHRNSIFYSLLNQYLYIRLFSGDELRRRATAQGNAFSQAERVETYRQIILQMRAATDRISADLRVVFAYPRVSLTRTRRISRETYEQLRQQFDNVGVTTWDLYEDLRAEALTGEHSLYYPIDIHWNARGHAFVSQLLERHIRDWLSAHASAKRRVVQ